MKKIVVPLCLLVANGCSETHQLRGKPVSKGIQAVAKGFFSDILLGIVLAFVVSMLFCHPVMGQKGSADTMVSLSDFEKAAEDDFYIAVIKGDVGEMRTSLLLHAVDVNRKYEGGYTALMFAALYCPVEGVELLLKNGADVNAKSDDGTTASVIAVGEGRPDVFKVLEENGADCSFIYDWALSTAASHADANAIEESLRDGANVNNRDLAGRTALMLAADKYRLAAIEVGNVQRKRNTDDEIPHDEQARSIAVELLLKNGADVNIQDKNGWTALMLSIREGHIIVVKVLLKNGADVNLKNSDGKAAIDYAKLGNHTRIVELLLEAGANQESGNAMKWGIVAGSCLIAFAVAAVLIRSRFHA